MSNYSYRTNNYSTTPKDVFGYRGFSQSEVSTLAESSGQGEACSKTGATGLYAAIEWIDNFYKLGNFKNGCVHPVEEFNWYGWDRFHSSVVDRSSPGKKQDASSVPATGSTTPSNP